MRGGEEVWYNALRRVGLQHITPGSNNAFAKWWDRCQQQVQRDRKAGLNTLIILVAWSLWKHRNRCVFYHAQPAVSFILRDIAEQATLWKLAGAAKLQLLG